MIEADLRKSIVTLHERGMGIRLIARQLSLSRNTVRSIIEEKGAINRDPRSDVITLDPDLLNALYVKCQGWRERIWEILVEEHGVEIAYPTLTRKIRELGLGVKTRVAHVPDEPGAEMQHDTSPYTIKIGGVSTKVVGSQLYFRYSKPYYLKFSRSFTRFRMKCFFHRALQHFGYVAPECIIDNTNLAVLHGTGANAVMVPEMAQFAKRYGFIFKAHEKGHCNRKAGEERGFWTVETNFFPGREFSSMEDLNAQALQWSTVTMHNRPRTKSKIIPAVAFEYEKAYLNPLVDGLPAPYLVHERTVDQYGFVAFDANHYWLPSGVSGDVKVLEYEDEIRIFRNREEIARFALPPEGTKNKIFPKDRPYYPYQPRKRDNATADEEKALRNCSPSVAAYLDFSLPEKGVGRHRFLRELFALQRRLSRNLFCQVIERAHRFKVVEVSTLEEIARILVCDEVWTLPDAHFNEGYADRESFREGRFTDHPDLAIYDRLLDEENVHHEE